MINERTRWITSDLIPEMSPDRDETAVVSLYFRREFQLSAIPEKAELYICALGLGVCTVNGNLVTEDVLTTPYTRYDKRTIYQKYDVTELLNDGGNAIGVHVGNGFYNNNMITWNDKMAPWRDRPKLALVLHIRYADGSEQTVETDDLWKTEFGPCLYNHMRQGEKYDARMIQHGYDKYGFDDGNWKNTVRAYAPGGILEENFSPPIRITEVLEPIRCENDIYDFGVNISGWVSITLRGERGREIKLSYDEQLNENGDLLGGAVHKFAKQESQPLCHDDIYICAGNGEEEYHPNFCYHGFRYVKVQNAPKDFKIVAHFVHTDFKRNGSFFCSDETLNRIHDMCIRSTKSNFVGIPTDCPHREQNGWTGDALVSADSTLMNFDAYDSYRKWLHDFTDAQRDNGHLPGIIPTGGWGYTGTFGPAWDSAVVLIPYKTYLHTGKTTIVKDMWNTMMKYMQFLETMSENYLVGYGLGDWCPPDFEDRVPNLVTDTAIYYEDLCAMAQMARLVGEDYEQWESLSRKVREAWRGRFIDFEGNGISEECSRYQTFYGCALYYKFYNDDQERMVLLNSLLRLIQKNDYHLDCGILGIHYVFTALSENGYADVVHKMITNPTYPGYGYWLNSGMTTLCETWSMNCSQNHQMFGGVDNWFYAYLGGIRYTEGGLIIAPVYLEEVERVHVEHAGICVERNGKDVHITLPVKAKIIINGEIKEADSGEYQYVMA